MSILVWFYAWFPLFVGMAAGAEKGTKEMKKTAKTGEIYTKSRPISDCADTTTLNLILT